MKKRYYSGLIIVILLLTVFSCSSNRNTLFDDESNNNYESHYQVRNTVSDQAVLDSLNNVVLPPYRLAPGDKIKVFVYDEPELNLELAIVKQDGSLSFPLVGEVFVAGLTVGEATKLIEGKLLEYILNPKVSLIVTEERITNVTILGKVTHPGTYQIKGSMRILDAIASAGGLALGLYPSATVELADIERTFIIRKNKLLPIDFADLVNNGNTRYNIPVLDKDYIYVPPAASKEIYVIGEVNMMGHYFYQENLSLMQSIAYAQGMKTTAQSVVYVIRGNLSNPHLYKIHTKAILKAKIKDFILKPNDIVFVPKNPVAKWNDVVDLALPSLQAFQSAWFLNDLIQKTGNN